MELSLFLAQVIGLLLVIMGVTMIMRRNKMGALVEQVVADAPLMFLSGFLALILGLIMVLSHNIWEMSYRGVITVFCWLVLLKGIARLWWPESVVAMARKFNRPGHLMTISVIAIVIGLWLARIGFVG